jgi:hypothetical protein
VGTLREFKADLRGAFCDADQIQIELLARQTSTPRFDNQRGLSRP